MTGHTEGPEGPGQVPIITQLTTYTVILATINEMTGKLQREKMESTCWWVF